MIIAVGSDHRGFDIKRQLLKLVLSLGHEASDCGADSKDSVDYCDFAFLVGTAVAEGRAHRGVLVSATGIGMCIAANKVPGIRAAPCHDSITAEMSRRHNDANVLCLSADLLGENLIDRMVRIWLETDFEGGRHARRVGKIASYEHRTYFNGKK